ncbi:GNAT family N-acetyltransferase [Hyphomicrobium sp. xq]|uniref:GNAT family N-acetyltransferase n=1 Tax=Hyphomicrobium album TaxID=2665159 RepID=A0A6I3KI46_9HYPH|nr:GNAT family N-acetyltransferase [Hyphomicrobium album]MTD94003.1 GNAT family N-acetyltransferase [Hyphomicrobium album]
MQTYRIVEAGANDLADVAKLFHAYAAELPVDLALQGFVAELAGLPSDYAPPKGVLLIARGADGAALGCIGLRPIDDRICEMKRLYVQAAARQTGLGKALSVAVIEAARQRGYREMKLDTLPQLKQAINLYRSLGFAPIAPYGDHPYEGTLCFGRML